MAHSRKDPARSMWLVSYAALLLFFFVRFALERLVPVGPDLVDPLSGVCLGVAIGAMIVAARRKRAT